MKILNFYKTEAKEINEYELSIVIHIMLLIALSIATVVKSIPAPKPKVVPVTLVAQVSKPKVGAIAPVKKEVGSQKAKGNTNKVAKPKATAPVKAKQTKSNAKPVQKAKPQPAKKVVSKPTSKPASVAKKAEPTQPQAVTTAVVPAVAVTPAKTNLPSIIDIPKNTSEQAKPTHNSPLFEEVSDLSVDMGNPTEMLMDLSGPSMPGGAEMLMPESFLNDEMMVTAPSDIAGPSTGTEDGTNGNGVVEFGAIEAFGGNNENFIAPSIISKVQPDYPDWARKKGIHGNAVYRVLIQPSGTVGDVVTMSSTIDPKLAIDGAQALRRWVFTPVLNNGVPQETWVKISVAYQLN